MGLMKKPHPLLALGLISLVLGIVLIAYSVKSGGSELFFVLIFPVLYGSDLYGILGMLLLLAAFIILPLSLAYHQASGSDGPKSYKKDAGSGGEGREYYTDMDYGIERKKVKSSTSGVIFIGPIPIIFGSDKGVARWMMVVAGIIAVIIAVIFILQIYRSC